MYQKIDPVKNINSFFILNVLNIFY